MAVSKGNQASIIVIDLRNVDPNGQLTQSQLETYAGLIVHYPKYHPGITSSHVMRVIFIYQGWVAYDYDPYSFGPTQSPTYGIGLPT